MERGNLGLRRAFQQRKPLRVIRGSCSKSDFAPASGFRYDGLYRITDYRPVPEGTEKPPEKGGGKCLIYQFDLVRIRGQLPPPWESTDPGKDSQPADKKLEDTQRPGTSENKPAL